MPVVPNLCINEPHISWGRNRHSEPAYITQNYVLTPSMPHTHPHAKRESGPSQGRAYSEAPLIVTWEVTQACELECDHCRAEAQPDRHPDELSTEEGRALIDRIGEFGSPSPILVISGGDPLQRPDLFELLEYAEQNSIRTGVTPAPTEELTPAVLDRLNELGVHRIALSLDGATANRHDSFRGEQGSFATIRRVAEHAQEIDLPIQINTTVTANTVEDLPAIANLVETLEAVMWEVFFLVPIGRGSDLAQLTPQQAERTLEWLYRRQRRADYRLITVEAPHYRRIAQTVEREEGGHGPPVGTTGDARGFVFVSHTGDIYPSGFLPVSVGNVRTDNLVSAYRNAPFFEKLRDPNQLKGPCGSCSFKTLCGGSRARAYAESGDPMESDPLCLAAALHD